ncbi:hypothetical protein [Kibdelosporangium philippinense]|uniref:hypothetical protein n=1 Tax=Kibdelosporangium philippinense TaxID=211113 RepID=UPI003618BCAA
MSVDLGGELLLTASQQFLMVADRAQLVIHRERRLYLCPSQQLRRVLGFSVGCSGQLLGGLGLAVGGFPMFPPCHFVRIRWSGMWDRPRRQARARRRRRAVGNPIWLASVLPPRQKTYVTGSRFSILAMNARMSPPSPQPKQ